MIKEIAVDPQVMATWQHFRELWEDCGVSRGRLLSEFPSDWRERVCKLAYELSSAKAASIVARLKPPPGQGAVRKWIATARSYDRGRDWLTNCEAQDGAHRFSVIIARSNPREKTHVLVAGEFHKDQAPWKTETQREISRTPETLLECVDLLLKVSRELVIVEPNFDATLERFRTPLAALVNSKSNGQRWARLELHVKFPTDRNGNLNREALPSQSHNLRCFLAPLIPLGNTLSVFFWQRQPGGKRVHPRYIVTELGGLQLDIGMDEGDAEGDSTTAALLEETVWKTVRDDYCRTSKTFLGGTGCNVDVVGQRA